MNGIRVDHAEQFAQALADGRLTLGQLRPQVPPEVLGGIVALAAERGYSPPLVAIGPDAATEIPAD